MSLLTDEAVLWSASRPTEVRRLPIAPSLGAIVALSFDDRWIIVSQGDNALYRLSLDETSPIQIIGSHGARVHYVQWLRDGLGIITSSHEVETLADSVDDAGGVMFVPAFVGLGAPYWDPSARGTIIGLTRGTTKAHLARAAVDSMAYQTLDVIEAMQLDSGIPLKTLKVDGGASGNSRLMQFQADLVATQVRRPQVQETTALGAAYLAGLAVGFWSSLDEVAANWVLEQEFNPQTSDADRYQRAATWRRAVERSRGWQVD